MNKSKKVNLHTPSLTAAYWIMVVNQKTKPEEDFAFAICDQFWKRKLTSMS